MKIIYPLILLLLLVGLANASYTDNSSMNITPTKSNFTELGSNWIKTCSNGLCKVDFYNEPINYLDGGAWAPINSTFVPSQNPNYDYEVSRGLYTVQFKANASADRMMRFQYDVSGAWGNRIVFFASPFAIGYTNDLGQQEIISRTQNVTGYPVSHIWPSEHHWFNTTDTMSYPNIFGYAVNLTFEYSGTKLKERLYVDPRLIPHPTIQNQNTQFNLVYKIELPANASIYLENMTWDNSTPMTTREAIGFIVKNKIMARMPKPIAYEKGHWAVDAGGNAFWEQRGVNASYRIYRVSGEYYLAIQVPISYLQFTDNFPLELDPTIEVSVGQSTDDAGDIGTPPVFDDNDNFYYPVHSTTASKAVMGVRFQNVAIPQGSSIVMANLTLSTWANCVARGGCNMNVKGVASDNTGTWTSLNRPIYQTNTTNFGTLSVTVSDVANGVYVARTITQNNAFPASQYFNSTVEEITNRTNWVSGNSMSFVLYQQSVGAGNNLKVFTYDSGNPSALLKVWYKDVILPIVNLSAPANATAFPTGDVNFSCNASDSGSGISNVSLWGNWSGGWHEEHVVNNSNLAYNKSTTNSSTFGSPYYANKSVDGNTSTLWASASNVNEWLKVDLGAGYKVGNVIVRWFDVYWSVNWALQASNDSATWTDVKNYSTYAGSTDIVTTIDANGTQARYWRIYMTDGNAALVAIRELEIYPMLVPVTFNITGITNGVNYAWNCKAYDKEGNYGWGQYNRTINVSSTSVCGTLTSSLTMTSDDSTTATCFIIGANGITLDCANFNVTYNTGGGSNAYGITSNGYSNITVKNCNFTEGSTLGDSNYGIYGRAGNNLTMSNNTVRTFSYGSIDIILSATNNSVVTDNRLYTTDSSGFGSMYGILAYVGIWNITISKNNISTGGSAGYGMYFYDRLINSSVFSNRITTPDIAIYMRHNITDNWFNNNTLSNSGIYYSDSNMRFESTGSEDVVRNNTLSNLTSIGKLITVIGKVSDEWLLNDTMNNSEINRSIIVVSQNANVTIQWYARVNVTDISKSALTSTINLTDNQSLSEYYSYQSLSPFFVVNDTKVYDDGGTKFLNYNNYTITVNRTGYTTNTTFYNFSTRDYTYNITLYASPLSDSCTYSGSGSWIIQFVDKCNITSSQYLGTNDLTFNGTTGYVTFGTPTNSLLVVTMRRFYWTANGTVYVWFKNSTWFNLTG